MSTDERLVRYLLGECSESEAEAVEGEYFAEGESFDALSAVEDELVEQYVQGALSAERRARFESHVLASREGQEKVRLARSLARVARERTKLLPWRPKAGRALLRFAALAAALAVAVIAAREAGVLPPRPQPGPSPTPLQPSGSPAEPGPATVAIADLVPGALRAGGTLPEVTLSDTTRVLRLRAFLDPAGAPRPSYRAVLMTSARREIARHSGLIARRSDAGLLLEVECATSDLAAGEYLLTVSATRTDGREEAVGDYGLRVVRAH